MQILQSLAAPKYELPYKSIPGVISARALEEHVKLYQGYLDLLKRVDQQLKDMDKAEIPKKHLPEHPFRALKEAETYALGGIVLHELFFDNLTNKPSDCKGMEVEKLIKEDFGSVSEWKRCMRGTIMEARGWAVLCVDADKHCRILMLDAHNVGAMFYQEPLVVIDVYEHSWFMEWGADKAGYADAILDVLNWEVINGRLNK